MKTRNNHYLDDPDIDETVVISAQVISVLKAITSAYPGRVIPPSEVEKVELELINVFPTAKPSHLTAILQTHQKNILESWQKFSASQKPTTQGRRKSWTSIEKNWLTIQAKMGKKLWEIKVPGRTLSGIGYKTRLIGLKLKKEKEPWSDTELKSLSVEARAGKSPWQVTMPRRSPLSIRNKMIRTGLYKPGIWKTKSWADEEKERLRSLVVELGMTARQIAEKGIFKGRTRDSIGQQMRRLGLVNGRKDCKIS